MDQEHFYVLSFESTSHAIQTEKLMKGKFATVTIPTPREITHSCGLSVKLLAPDLNAVMVFLDALKVPYGFYRLSEGKTEGKRSVEPVRTNAV